MEEKKEIKFYNTIKRDKEPFCPIEKGKVRIYSCGPTVYNFAHIGNMRTYIFMDLLTRTLRYAGYEVNSVMNITDVGHLLSDADDGEDKMVKASKEQKKTPQEIAKYYTDVFFEDLKKLNITLPNKTPKATEHINEMIKDVEMILKNGYGYITSDGIYYDIAKFKDYGKLSGINLEDQLAGARVEVNEEKKNPADFAIWKNAPKEHIMQWESPWGMGYPGWHIECTAMSNKYLGNTFDIHTGGVDHIPVHHENEIAQNFAVNNCKPCNYWMHGEFMLVDGGKMSKKLNNTYTLSQLEEMGYSAMDFRFFCLNTHYRNKLNFTFEGINAAKTSYSRLKGQLARHAKESAATDKQGLEKYMNDFEEAIFDDLNLPKALGVLFLLLKETPSKDVYDLVLKMDKIFGLELDKETKEEKEEIPKEIEELVQERLKARAEKDWARSDELRKEIEDKGYCVIDKKDGCDVKKK